MRLAYVAMGSMLLLYAAAAPACGSSDTQTPSGGGGANSGVGGSSGAAAAAGKAGAGATGIGGSSAGAAGSAAGAGGTAADAGVRDADSGDGTAGAAPDGATDDGLHPVLKNFQVVDGSPDRLYFDSSEPISAAQAAGFIVSGRSVTGIHAEAGSTTGHYLTVDTGFTFYDNTTIRYEGGADLKDLQGNGLYEFTLQYVENRIPEPTASTSRFVTAAAAGAGDGTSETAAWTMAQAGANAEAGQTVWIKAGDYGDARLLVSHSGTATAPIKFIGYRATPGDNPSLPRNQDTVFDAGVMPYIHSQSDCASDSANCRGVDFGGRRFITVKNIQIEGYYDSLLADGNVSDCLVENVYSKNASYYGLNFFAVETRRVRAKGCYVLNAGGAGIRVSGDHNLIDDMYACSRGAPNMDYYISLYGGTIGTGNIVRNSAIVRDPSDSHTGHGFSVKAGGRPLEHTLIENCTIRDVAQAVELRHHQTRYTIVRGVVATGNRAGNSNLVTFRDGTSDNVVENCLANAVYSGVLFTETDEDGTAFQACGQRNKVVNTVFNDCRYNIMVRHMSGWTSLESTDNEFLNCTFYGADYMFDLIMDFGNTNHLTNCNIVNVAHKVSDVGVPTTTYTNCNSWGSWEVVPGTGNVSLDPLFVNAANGDLHLQSSSPIRDLGADLTNVHYDKDGVERAAGRYSIGAYE
jgi:trimeric autotransporter adhesin